MTRCADTCLLVLQKTNAAGNVRESYVFVFDDTQQSHADAMRTFGRYASTPDLTFTWYDAAVMSQRLRAMAATK